MKKRERTRKLYFARIKKHFILHDWRQTDKDGENVIASSWNINVPSTTYGHTLAIREGGGRERERGRGGGEREGARERERGRERERMNKLYFTRVVEKTRGLFTASLR